MKRILFAIIIFFTTPYFVLAASDDISQFYIDAQVDIAGSMNVKELIVVDGPFNGYFRGITYANTQLNDWTEGNINFENSAIYNGSGISNVEIKAKYITGTVSFDSFLEDFESFEEKDFATNGEKHVYTTSSINAGTEYKMYYPAKENQKVAFLISYTITNVAVIHNDVAEVYWQFIGTDFKNPIQDLKIRLTLPSEDTSDYFRIWGHGALSGNLTALTSSNNKYVGGLLEITNLSSSAQADIRLTFDKDIIEIKEFINHSKQDAFKSIHDVENKKTEDTKKQKEAVLGRYYTTLISCIAYCIILVGLWIYIYIKFDKEHHSNFKTKYYREFIDEYPVEVIDYLMNKSISPNAMSASIMNLIYKKNVQVEEITNSKKKKEYKFTLINKKNMSENEMYLSKFLFEKVGTDNTFTNKDLERYASGTNTYSKFTSNYETWKRKVIKEGKTQEFYENDNKIKIIGVVYALVGVLLFVMASSIDMPEINIASIPTIILSIIFLIYTITFTKRTLKGNDHYLKWKAFRNFLNDFSILEERELPEIIMWERYMVYAVILGVADKVQKAMNVRITEIDPNMSNYSYSPAWNLYMHMNLSRMINNSVQTAVNESISKAAASSSTGSGFGGGLSGGSGFGGGGGGTGGRF